MKTCLLVIDVQHEFKNGCLSCGMVDDGFIERVRKLIEFCREKDIEVIYTQHLVKKDKSDKEKYLDDPCFWVKNNDWGGKFQRLGKIGKKKTRKNDEKCTKNVLLFKDFAFLEELLGSFLRFFYIFLQEEFCRK